MQRAGLFGAVTLLAVVVGAAVCGAAASRPSRATSAPAQAGKYFSKRYGYEMVLGGKYTMMQALGQWSGGFPFGSTGEVDVIVDDEHDRKFIVAAMPVSSGRSLSRWDAFVVKVQRSVCDGLRSFRRSSLGGEPAREFVSSCPDYRVITLAALHQGRGYLLNYLSAPSSNAASERRIYEAGRRAFRFTQK